MSESALVPNITDAEKRLLLIVEAIKELRASKHRLLMAGWYCSHSGKLQVIEDHVAKILADLNGMINYLEKIYKKDEMMYNRVKEYYDSLETIIEEQ